MLFPEGRGTKETSWNVFGKVVLLISSNPNQISGQNPLSFKVSFAILIESVWEIKQSKLKLKPR